LGILTGLETKLEHYVLNRERTRWIIRKSALLIIDAQLGPLNGTYKQEETFTVIQNLITRAENDEIPIFYIQHEELEGSFLENGSPFWQFAPGIVPCPSDIIIHKQSADSFYQTALNKELKQLEVNHLVFAGARTEYCVDTTCRSAITLGFDVTLAADVHTTADGVIPAAQIIRHHNHNLSTVKTVDRNITVIPSKDITFLSASV
jgi:nicotinamidase-related amidase